VIVDVEVAAVEIHHPVLHVRFGGPARLHLATLAGKVQGPRGRHAVLVGILAASHQVLVDGVVVETVTCDDPGGVAVEPGTHLTPAGLTFGSDLEVLGPDAFGPTVEHLVDTAGRGHRTLAARFPNDRLAVTAVALSDRGWRSTHTYPRAGGGGVLVTTVSELR
jgi:hypothetical protein